VPDHANRTGRGESVLKVDLAQFEQSLWVWKAAKPE
jgi:hypothetical protein